MNAWKRFRRNRLAVAAALVLVVLHLAAALAPVIAPFSPTKIDLLAIFQRPDGKHLWGTDDLGRDVLSRAIWGARVSLSVGLISMGIAVVVGVLIGSVAGFAGGIVDQVLTRITDAFMAFPMLLLLIVLASYLGPSLMNTILVIGLTSWPSVARLTRGEVLSLRRRDFVTAAIASGATDGRLLWKHILRNAVSPIIVASTLGVANAILTESALSFLGLGVQPPTPSWGNMLSVAQRSMVFAPWNAVYPGLLVFLTVLSFNLVGDGLRDALDPNLKQASK